MTCWIALNLCLVYTQTTAMPVQFSVYPNYFERNDSGLTGAVSYLIIEDRKAFDALFGLAVTMGPKPNTLPLDAFDSEVVVALIKRGDKFWEYTVEGVTEETGVLTVRYKALPGDGKGARFASPLVIAVPKTRFREVVFVEGGKEVGKVVKKPQADEGRSLFDFAKPDAAQAWQPVNDSVMGGVSEGRFKITDQGTMEFFGRLSLENNGGFASVRSRRQDLQLKSDDTLFMRLRGDGREYLLNLYVPSLEVAYSYRAAIPTKADAWTEVRIPLKDCYATSFGRRIENAPPVDAGKINSIGFMLSDNKARPFKLEIAWVKVISK